MEITRRDDIGADLKAPSAARGGGVTPGTRLCIRAPGRCHRSLRQPRGGDHGVERRDRWRGARAIYWVARGTSPACRRAGSLAARYPCAARPLPGARTNRSRLLRSGPEKGALLDVRQTAPGAGAWPGALLPVESLPDTLRTYQSYLAKLPQGSDSMFPRLRAAVEPGGGMVRKDCRVFLAGGAGRGRGRPPLPGRQPAEGADKASRWTRPRKQPLRRTL